MTMTFVARFKVKAEKDAEFVKLIAMAEKNAAEEPDTLAYKFYRQDAPHSFAVFESFTDAAADKKHQENPKSQPVIAKMLECMDGTYTREYLLPV